jgi:predicted lipoprotein
MFTRRRINMHGRSGQGVVIAALLVTVLLAACSKVPGVYTYVSAKSGASGEGGAFSPKSYVDQIWASKVLPTVQAKAQPATTLLAALKADPAGTGKKFGKQSGVGGPYSYLIKGTGTVTKYDKSSPTGPLTLTLTGTKQQIYIATGPVLAGTSLRDAVGFIDFNQFANQIDYAAAGDALNAKVKTEVIAKTPPQTLVGKKISFAGAFTALSPDSVLVIPTQLQAAP